MEKSDALQHFLDLSEHLTGHEVHRLVATGMDAVYFDTMSERVGVANMEAMLAAFDAKVAGADEPERSLRHAILGDPCFGPMARHLIKLWYIGTWKQMPDDWRTAYAGGLPDGDIIPDPAAYTEGLLWPTVGANPPGAKPFGYAMWAKPPRVTLD